MGKGDSLGPTQTPAGLTQLGAGEGRGKNRGEGVDGNKPAGQERALPDEVGGQGVQPD